jgi:hypothetical protein
MIGLIIYLTLGACFTIAVDLLATMFGGPFFSNQERAIVWLLWPLFVIIFIASLLSEWFK